MRRRWFSRRAFVLHFLLVTIVPGCFLAGWWQVHRALGGNLLSYFYSIEWPVFALLGAIAWWQLIHDVPSSATDGQLAGAGQAPAAGSGPEERERALVWDKALETPELTAYNEYLGRLAAGRARKTWRNPKGLPGEAAGEPTRTTAAS